MKFMSNHKAKLNAKFLFFTMLASLLTITIISGLVFAIFCNSLARGYAKAETKACMEDITKQVMAFLSPPQVCAENFTTFAKKRPSSQSLNVIIHALGENIPYASAAYYGTKISRHTEGGFFIDSSDWVPPDSWEASKTDWFKHAVDKKGEMNFENPYLDEMTHKPCVTLSKALVMKDGSIPGVFAVDLLLDNLTEIIKAISISKNGKVHLILSDGTYLTHQDDTKVMTAKYFEESDIPYSAADFLDGRQKTFIHEGRFYAVEAVSTSNWFIVAEGPVSDFTGNIIQGIIIFELALFVLSLIFASLNAGTIKKMRSGEKTMGKQIFDETQNLVVSAKENAATAQDQSAAVKEIVATMEDNTSLSENISQKIIDVAEVAKNTSEDVVRGVTYLEQNVRQLTEIADANQKTIEGIKSLGDKIENIWDIVSLINSVADQAKIIAFNAELEASSAGEAGKNFHIVATEIRRLADGIIDGTKEIKSKITEIQQSSDMLILASENGTEKIQSGVENAKSLEDRFTSIKNASEVTAGSAGEITTIIQQQAMASEQILITLRQIAAGVENFSSATENISQVSQNLKTIAGELAQKNNGEADA